MKKVFQSIRQWLINDCAANNMVLDNAKTIDWIRIFPFILIHLGCLLAFWVGFSWVAFFTALFLYWVRLFSISAFYHRYFSHRAYKTSRKFQFIFALMGASAVQRGPLWWASHHRNHHQVTEQPGDPHSPIAHGFLWSHMGWFLSKKNFYYNQNKVKDMARFPELLLLERYYVFVPLALAGILYLSGYLLQHWAPMLNTNGSQMLIWGFFISTTVLFHTTAIVNSLAHLYGKQKYKTKNNSRNNIWIALLTFGEGWHNNHHHYPASIRQGFQWWEIDISFYILKLLEKMGIIWDLCYPPKEVVEISDKEKMLGLNIQANSIKQDKL